MDSIKLLEDVYKVIVYSYDININNLQERQLTYDWRYRVYCLLGNYVTEKKAEKAKALLDDLVLLPDFPEIRSCVWKHHNQEIDERARNQPFALLPGDHFVWKSWSQFESQYVSVDNPIYARRTEG